MVSSETSSSEVEACLFMREKRKERGTRWLVKKVLTTGCTNQVKEEDGFHTEILYDILYSRKFLATIILQSLGAHTLSLPGLGNEHLPDEM
jgi:hypothetical protein